MSSKTASKRKRPGFWRGYHLAGNDMHLDVFNIIVEVVGELDPPWQTRARGRRPKLTPRDYAALCIFMVYFDVSYRGMESWSEILLGKRIDHSRVGRMLHRLPVAYVDDVVSHVHHKVEETVDGMLTRIDRGEANPAPPFAPAQAGGDGELADLIATIGNGGVYVGDSTGVVTDRYEARHHGYVREGEARQHTWLKLHIVAKYWWEVGLISIAASSVTKSRAGDAGQAPALLRRAREGAVDDDSLAFFDSAYDAEAVFQAAYETGCIPMIKPRDRTYAGSPFRNRAVEQFNSAVFRQYRAMVEGIFGGTQTRCGNAIRARLDHTRKVVTQLIAVGHDLRTLRRARAQLSMAS